MSLDLPAVVVHEQVVMSTEQHAIVDRCCAAAGPLEDVVGFAPTGRAFAAGPTASAISHSQCCALTGRKQALSAANIEYFAATVERDGQPAGIADHAARGLRSDRGGRAVDETDAGLGCEFACRDYDSDSGPDGAKRGRIASSNTDANQIDEGVEPNLVIGARVGRELFGSADLDGVDKPRATPARVGRVIARGDDCGGGLRVKQTGEPPHPINFWSDAEETPIAEFGFTFEGRVAVEFFARHPRVTGERVGVETG